MATLVRALGNSLVDSSICSTVNTGRAVPLPVFQNLAIGGSTVEPELQPLKIRSSRKVPTNRCPSQESSIFGLNRLLLTQITLYTLLRP